MLPAQDHSQAQAGPFQGAGQSWHVTATSCEKKNRPAWSSTEPGTRTRWVKPDGFRVVAKCMPRPRQTMASLLSCQSQGLASLHTPSPAERQRTNKGKGASREPVWGQVHGQGRNRDAQDPAAPSSARVAHGMTRSDSPVSGTALPTTWTSQQAPQESPEKVRGQEREHRECELCTQRPGVHRLDHCLQGLAG